MEVRQLTCIQCPRGCQVEVQLDKGEVKAVAGNSCKRGDAYARKEVVNPTRIVTSTVCVEGGIYERVPVKTLRDVPKDLVFDIMDVVNKVHVKAPVRAGDILVEDICGTGVSLVTTANVGSDEPNDSNN